MEREGRGAVARVTTLTGRMEKVRLWGKNQSQVGNGRQAEGRRLIYVFSLGFGKWGGGGHRASHGLGESMMRVDPQWGAW